MHDDAFPLFGLYSLGFDLSFFFVHINTAQSLPTGMVLFTVHDENLEFTFVFACESLALRTS